MPIETIVVELKSGLVEIEQFTDIPTAIAFFMCTDENGIVMVNGEACVLQLINHRHQLNQVKEARDFRRPVSLKRLCHLTRENPEFRAAVDALLLEFGQPQLKK